MSDTRSYQLIDSIVSGYSDDITLADISSSQLRCQSMGMKPEDKPIVRIPGSVMLQRRHLEKVAIDYLVDDLHEFTSSLGGVVLHAYDDAVVVNYQSTYVLNWFRQHGIMEGLDLKEESLGTTAFCLMKDGREEAWVHGQDHYLEFLKGFASYCTRVIDADGALYTFILIPEENFDDRAVRYFRLYEKAKREAIRRYYSQLRVNSYRMLESSEDSHVSNGSMFVDTFGRVLWFDDVFGEMMGVIGEEPSSIDARELLPWLPDILRNMSKDESSENGSTMMQPPPSPAPRTVNGRFVVCIGYSKVFYHNSVSALCFRFSSSRLNASSKKSNPDHAIYTFSDIVGASTVLRITLQQAQDSAVRSTPILLLGESGTGKELVAQSIHNASMRSKMPFVALNCSNMRSDLAESELFGYVPGAFTGASSTGAVGKIEHADGGTLFLDEVGELSADAQTMLLRVLEDHKVFRIGSNVPKNVDFRLICATNRNLWEMVKDGRFRLDLYYRLNVISITLPPLRERYGDIELLARYFVARFAEANDTAEPAVEQDALEALEAYNWPGNIRELRNVIERACISAGDGDITLECFPADFRVAVESGMGSSFPIHEHMSLRGDRVAQQPQLQSASQAPTDLSGAEGMSVLEAEERKNLIALFVSTGGNKSKMAKELGISRTTLYRKLERYGLS